MKSNKETKTQNPNQLSKSVKHICECILWSLFLVLSFAHCNSDTVSKIVGG